MPRHDKSATPPEKRRAPKGSRVGRKTIHFTADGLNHLQACIALWRLSDSAAVMKALAQCASNSEEPLPPSLQGPEDAP